MFRHNGNRVPINSHNQSAGQAVSLTVELILGAKNTTILSTYFNTYIIFTYIYTYEFYT